MASYSIIVGQVPYEHKSVSIKYSVVSRRAHKIMLLLFRSNKILILENQMIGSFWSVIYSRLFSTIVHIQINMW
jgi:hypothetical protein